MSESSFLKNSHRGMLVILTLAVIPMLIIAIYARPLADDFGYSAPTHDAWVQSHSLIQLLSAARDKVVDKYLNWQGSFAALFLFTLEPAVFSEKIYGISTAILIFFFLIGNYMFFRAIFGNEKEVGGIAYSAVSIILLETLPHAFQGFYWWNGASYYTLFHSLMLILWALVLKNRKTALACILGVIIGGGNLVTGLLNIEVLAIYLLAGIIYKKKDLLNRFVVFIFSLAGFLVNILALGNAVRAADSVATPAFFAVGKSFLDAYAYFNEWFNLPVAILLLFLAPFMAIYAVNHESIFKDVHIGILLTAFICLFASMFTPTEYATSEVGPRRVQNIRYYMFVIFLVLTEMEIIVRVVCAFGRKEINAAGADLKIKFIRSYWCVIMIMLVFFLGINILPKENRQNLTSIAAARSVLIGEARNYANEMDERFAILKSEDKVVTLKTLYNHPACIYYADFDLTGNNDDYRDRAVRKYYHKDHIILDEN